MSEAAAEWADVTTQDEIEAQAARVGWHIMQSTSSRSTMMRNGMVLVVKFSTRERGGKIHTVVQGWQLTGGTAASSKTDHVYALINQFGRVISHKFKGVT